MIDSAIILTWLWGLRGAAPPAAHKRKGHKRNGRHEHGDEHVIEFCYEGGQAESTKQDNQHWG